jgi:hypothetical protein
MCLCCCYLNFPTDKSPALTPTQIQKEHDINKLDKHAEVREKREWIEPYPRGENTL